MRAKSPRLGSKRRFKLRGSIFNFTHRNSHRAIKKVFFIVHTADLPRRSRFPIPAVNRMAGPCPPESPRQRPSLARHKHDAILASEDESAKLADRTIASVNVVENHQGFLISANRRVRSIEARFSSPVNLPVFINVVISFGLLKDANERMF